MTFPRSEKTYELLNYGTIKSNKIDWNQYRERFIVQMRDNPKSTELIHWLSRFENKNNNVTLICFCENEKSCHRSIVKDLAASFSLGKTI